MYTVLSPKIAFVSVCTYMYLHIMYLCYVVGTALFKVPSKHGRHDLTSGSQHTLMSVHLLACSRIAAYHIHTLGLVDRDSLSD